MTHPYLDEDLSNEFQATLQVMEEKITITDQILVWYMESFADMKADSLGCSEEEIVEFLKKEWALA
jgi:hypothetical protein